MRTPRTRLSRREASRRLDHPGTPAGDPLSTLLAAASTPAGVDPAGENRATALFRASARLDPVPSREGASAMTRFGRKIVAAPAAALAAAGLLVAGGGLAMAASQGAVHVPFTGHDHRSTHAPSAPATSNPGLTRAESTAPSAPESTEPASPSASPSPSLAGLCVAFQAGAAHDGKDNPAFNALTTAAGGADQVAAYCTGLIGPSTKPTHPARPTHPTRPTQAAQPTHPAKPSQAATPAPSRVASSNVPVRPAH
jgi:hypothetical protein